MSGQVGLPFDDKILQHGKQPLNSFCSQPWLGRMQSSCSFVRFVSLAWAKGEAGISSLTQVRAAKHLVLPVSFAVGTSKLLSREVVT